jgi:Flp pilus assembly protein TadG
VAESGAVSISRPRKRRPFRRGEEGASLVEFALVLPIFAVLLFGLIDFGLIFGGYIEMRSGVQAAARLASVDQYQYTGGGNCSGTAANAATTSMACTVASDIGSLPGVTTSQLQIGIAFNPANDGSADSDVIVCAKGPMHSTTGLTAPFINGNTVSTKSIIRIEKDADYSTFAAGSSVTLNGTTYQGYACPTAP